MVYPVSSQAIPASNTFQPGGTAESIALKKPEDNKQVDVTKPAGTETARSQASETRGNNQVERSFVSNDRAEDTGRITASTTRGSTLNITV